MDVEDEEHDQNNGRMEGYISSPQIPEGDVDGNSDDEKISLPDAYGEGDQVESPVPDPTGRSGQGVAPNTDPDHNPDDDHLDTLFKKSGLSDQDKLRWRVAKAFFDDRGLIADHINSYNYFVERGIHDMFDEAGAEPFEVELPDEERFSGKKIFVHFGKVEIDIKPEVEKKDRVVEWKGPSGMDAFDKGDKGKGFEFDVLGKGKMSWLVDTDDGPDLAGNNGAGGSGTKAGDDNRADKGKRGEQNVHSGKDKRKLDSPDSERQDVTGKGKAKAVDMDMDDLVDLCDDEEEDLPPTIVTKETFDDGSDQSDLMDVDDHHRGRAGRAHILDSPPSSPSSPVRSNGHAARGTSNGGTPNRVHDDGSRMRTSMNGFHAMANGGKTAGTSDPDSRSPPLGMPRSGKGNLKLMPMEARIRGMTYAAPIYCEVTIETRLPTSNKRQKSSSSTASPSYKKVYTPDRVLLGKIPVMVKSSLCHLKDSSISTDAKGDCALDPGGYFIIRGSEKVIVAQEERNQKRLWVHHNKGAYVAQCIPRRKGFGNYNNYRRTLVKLDVPKKTGANAGTGRPVITVTVVGVDAIPMGVYFSALGVNTDKGILELICYDFKDTELMDVVVPSLVESDEALELAMKDFNENSFEDVKSRKAKKVAVHLIGSKSVRKIVSEEKTQEDTLRDIREKLLPHLNPSNRSKALYLGYMIRTVCLCYLGREKPTEKDDFKNKRLDFAGEVISHHFRKLMGTMRNTMKKRMQKHLVKGVELGSPTKYLDEKVITRGLKAAFSSGNWQGHDQMKNSGIVFDLKRGNPISGICQLRELRQFVPASIRLGDEARHPTFTQWGRVCPIDTPDGDDCGLVKNMAITGVVTGNTPEGPVLDICEEYNMTELSKVKGSTLQHFTRVFVNGRWAGSVGSNDADALVEALRSARRSVGRHLTQIEVAHNPINLEIHISTDPGRVVRPLLIVSNGHLVLSDDHRVRMKRRKLPAEQCFRWLLEHQVVELLGIEEEEKAMIALQVEDLYKDKAPKFTHAEVHPSLMLGLSASLIPFPNRNQSSRNLYQAHKHCKQAIGIYTTNISSRADTSGHHLYYPQIQLVQTNTFQSLDKMELFSGQNAIVAIACYTGYNQEDSIIMDQSSLDRGMFRTTHYRTIKNVEKPDYETFGKPAEDEDHRNSRSLEKLEEDGFPGIGMSLGVHDTIVGKVAKPQYNAEPSARTNDPSQRLKAHERGCVSQVVLLSDEDGNRIAKVKLRESRMPQVGDKFSSMHGQKGILGMTFTQEDLPFTCEGIVPDIIINPHAFPSRQTLGQMYESALGKFIASKGIRRFATPFNPACTVETIAEALHEAGYERWGSETLCNGYTGEPMEAMIFMGTTFYQRLDHMVEDKLKYRSRGHVHPLTRQPVADRKRNGGVKFGEMERDCLIAHGASATLQERSFILSDFHTVHVCTNCEQLANRNADRLPVCQHCVKAKGKKKTNSIVKVELPYACKLLMQELMSMGISVRLKTQQL